MIRDKFSKRLKIFLSSILCITLINNGFTQESGSKSNHQINISVDNIFAKSTIQYPVYNQYGDLIYYPKNYNTFQMPKPIIGLGYKYSFSNNGILVKVNIGRQNYEKKTTDDDYYGDMDPPVTNVSNTNMITNIGYERQLNFEKTRIFFGISGFLDYNEYYSKTVSYSIYYDYDYYDPYDPYGQTSEQYKKTNKNINIEWGYGFSPLAGVQYFLTDHLSLSTEIKCFVRWYKNEYTYKYDSEMSTSSENGTKKNGNNLFIGPLGNLSFNIHF